MRQRLRALVCRIIGHAPAVLVAGRASGVPAVAAVCPRCGRTFEIHAAGRQERRRVSRAAKRRALFDR